LVSLGAIAEFGYCTVSPMGLTLHPTVAKAILALGAENCIIISDQDSGITMPHEALRSLRRGCSNRSSRRRRGYPHRRNPAKLLGIPLHLNTNSQKFQVMYYRAHHQPVLSVKPDTFWKVTNPAYIAGGTDLMVQLRERQGRLKSLLDISSIPELKQIRQAGSEIFIGAAVTFQEIIDSQLLRREAPLLVHAAQQTGAAQIQHMGTIGGNIANASPAGDTLPSLYILDASLVLVSEKGERSIPISEFICGVRKTALQPELIKEICFSRLPAAQRRLFSNTVYAKARPSRSSGSCRHRNQGEAIHSARIALGAVAPAISVVQKQSLSGWKVSLRRCL